MVTTWSKSEKPREECARVLEKIARNIVQSNRRSSEIRPGTGIPAKYAPLPSSCDRPRVQSGNIARFTVHRQLWSSNLLQAG